MERLAAAVPLTLGLTLVERSWPEASAALRSELCFLADELSSEGLAPPDLNEIDVGELDASIRKQAARMLTQTLAAPTMAFWKRLGRALLDVDPHLLVYAIQAAGPSLAERRKFLAAWLDDRRAVEEHLAALSEALRVPVHGQELCDAVFEHLISRFATDADALARALLRLDGRAPAPVIFRLALAVIDAAPRRVQERSLGLRQALALARRIVARRSVGRRRKPPEPRAGKRRKRRSPEQLDLGIETP
ncbi:MAG TPA: hypothetical protein VN618_04150 [Solirubrobacteraceae bacterium]|nr:hypothetical protein [Solirubrobacteraceae bacterium]